MNATDKQKPYDPTINMELSLLHLEKSNPPSIWSRIKKALAPSDLTLESWQRLEAKRSRTSFKSNIGRDL